jgi:hypothetical protein
MAAHAALGVFLALMLAANSVAEAQGPISWLAFIQLPNGGGSWSRMGPLLLLPFLSVGCWLVYRWGTADLPRWQWGWWPISVTMAALGLFALLHLTWQCVQQACDLAAILRLLLLLALFWWVYLFVLNERPNLFWLLVLIIAVQSAIAIGQFFLQHDLGLQFLGELNLNPEEIGTTVVMNNGRRWLRSYGLTRHPNTLSQMLVLGLMLLLAMVPLFNDPRRPTADRQQQNGRRPLPVGGRFIAAVFALGLAGVFVTLSRWSWVCLAVGLLVLTNPFVRRFLRKRQMPSIPKSVAWFGLAGVLVLVIGSVVYGDVVLGRFLNLNNPIENRSLWERERDVVISLTLLQGHPWTGVGFGNYLNQAVRLDWWAEPVHSVPLMLGAELGLPGMGLWLALIIAPLLRRDAFSDDKVAVTAVLLVFGLLGLLQPGPHPLYEVQSALLAGLVLSICPSISSRV